jgi:hypothetical protein
LACAALSSIWRISSWPRSRGESNAVAHLIFHIGCRVRKQAGLRNVCLLGIGVRANSEDHAKSLNIPSRSASTITL